MEKNGKERSSRFCTLGVTRQNSVLNKKVLQMTVEKRDVHEY